MRAYAKGVRAEKKSRKLLEAEGYLVVESRGSHGAWDLVGLHLKGGSPLARLVQVKVNQALKPRPQVEAPWGPQWTRRETHYWRDRAAAPTVVVW